MLAVVFVTSAARAQTPLEADVMREVSSAVRPVMKQYAIPGMAVGITIDGRHYLADFGVASVATGARVTPDTLFEIGSLTKTFTATLVAYARRTGKLSLADRVSDDLPELRGSAFDKIRLINLGTHTAGGLPLQFPDDVKSDTDAIAYYKKWKPSEPPGTTRLYSNPSIMLLGLIAARRLHEDFATAMQSVVLHPLGMRNTFLNMPRAVRARYAQGYTDNGTPHRVDLGPLAFEAYGVRTSASDMLRFLDANLGSNDSRSIFGNAIGDTHIGYFRIGRMTQDLIWEQYPEPASLSDVLSGKSKKITFEGTPAVKIQPPSAPKSDVYIDKSGSTSGFSAYAAFSPSRKVGIVLLANRSFPNAARVAAAYRVLSRLRDYLPRRR